VDRPEDEGPGRGGGLIIACDIVDNIKIFSKLCVYMCVKGGVVRKDGSSFKKKIKEIL
jgi:hypothetical protein